jgi:glycosyltransferase involved in cell wall biosynthesis
MPRKIMLVAPWMFDGGIERLIESKALWLAERGYGVEVFVFDIRHELSGRPNPILAHLEANGIPVHTLPVYGPRLHLTQRALHLASVAVQRGFEVIVAHEIMANMAVMLTKSFLRSRIRAIAEFHTSLKFPSTGIDARTLYRAQKMLRRADRIVTVSEGTRNEIIEYYQLPPALVSTIYNSFDLTTIRRLALEEPARPVDGPFILGCGRLVDMKGFDDLIEAFSRIAVEPRHRDLRLVILGEGALQESLEAAARERGVGDRVIFGGFQANPWAYFSRASVFCLSSRYGEAFGRVLVEAMACGTPVIASRCQWGPDEVLDQGKCGLLYQVGNTYQLVERLRAVLEDGALRTHLIAQGRARSEDFGQDRVMPMLEACYFP